MEISMNQIARIMDALIVDPDVSAEKLTSLVDTMKQHPFATITVDLYYLPLVAKLLNGSSIDVGATISYPLGGLPTPLKIKQVEWAVKNGADEMDVVMNMYLFKCGEYDALKKEIETIVEIAEDRIVKIIPMTARLDPEEIKLACKIIEEAGANFISTNTVFGQLTTTDHVKTIKNEFGDRLRVVAAGGVQNAETAFAMLEAGADRIATDAPFDVFNTLKDAQNKLGEQKVEKIIKRIETLIKEVPKRRK